MLWKRDHTDLLVKNYTIKKINTHKKRENFFDLYLLRFLQLSNHLNLSTVTVKQEKIAFSKTILHTQTNLTQNWEKP